MQAVVEDAVLGLALDDGHGGAFLSRRAGAHDAGVAAAHHHDVGLDGGGDLVVGYDGRLAEPRGVGGLGVRGGSLGGLGGGHGGDGGTAGGDGHSSRGGTGDERTTAHVGGSHGGWVLSGRVPIESNVGASPRPHHGPFSVPGVRPAHR